MFVTARERVLCAKHTLRGTIVRHVKATAPALRVTAKACSMFNFFKPPKSVRLELEKLGESHATGNQEAWSSDFFDNIQSYNVYITAYNYNKNKLSL
jgi:hypothetical protein